MNRQPLKGLLLYTLFSAKGHLIMASILLLAFSIFAILAGTTPVTSVIAMLFFPVMYLLSNAAEIKEGGGNWHKFQLSMPIRRKDVITSKYLFFLLLTTLALLMTGIVEGVAHLLDFLDILQVGSFRLGGVGPMVELMETIATSQISMYAILFSLGNALLTCVLSYPLNYTIFKGKEEHTALLVLIGNVGINLFMMWLALRLEFTFNQTMLLGVIAPALLLIPSYFFTVKVFQKADV